jgi:arylsulfatase A-like enzyme
MALAVIHALLSCACGPAPETAPRRPNILLIVADDIGLVDLGVHNPGFPSLTPNIDTLARAGMRFSDAHSPATLCVPSRYGVLTGNYTWRARVPGGAWKSYKPSQILPGQQTIADILRGAGYSTAFFGKWHLGGSYYRKGSDEFTEVESEIDFGRRFRGGPIDAGFDYSFILPSGIQARPRAFFRDDKAIEGAGTPGAVASDWDPSAVGPRLFEDALAFIERHHEQDQARGTQTPFYLHYSATEVHAPHAPAVELAGIRIRGRTGRGARADLVWQLDVIVGKLLEALAQRDMLNDTLVVFTSDNGSVLSGDLLDSGSMSGSKGTAEEGGHRVPLIVRWGDGTAEGSRVAPDSHSAQLIGIQDLVATAAELAGVELPLDQAVDSISILDTLTGRRPDDRPLRDNLMIWAQNRLNPDRKRDRKIVLRRGTWKLVVDGDHAPVGLYDLASSTVEDDANNLVDSPGQSDRVEAMTREFARLYNAPRSVPARPKK